MSDFFWRPQEREYGTREGPALEVTASCDGCVYHRHVGDVVRGGMTYGGFVCTHENAQNKTLTSYDTPSWCPLLKHALTDLAREVTNGEGG